MKEFDMKVSDLYYMDPTEHEFIISVGELRLLYFDWIDRLIDELEDHVGYEAMGRPVIAHARERLERIGEVLGKREVYETLVHEMKQRKVCEEGLRAFHDDWDGFSSLDPERDHVKECQGS